MPDKSSTTSGAKGIITMLIINGIYAVVYLTIFLIVRPKNKRVYQKKLTSSVVPNDRRPRALAKGVFAWFKDLITRPDSEVIAEAGLDAYFFLRFLRFLFYISFFGMILLWPILFPLHATGGGGQTDTNVLLMSNIRQDRGNRYYAHVFLSWIFFGGILFFIYRESVYYVSTRQAVLTSDAYRTRISSRSIIVNSVPKELLTEQYLTSLFVGVKKVYLAHDAKKLAKVIKKRDKLAAKAEGAANKVIKKGVKARVKAEKKTTGSDNIRDYVKKMPTHRLKFLIGKKVETLEYAKQEIPKLNKEIAKLQSGESDDKLLTAAVVTFHTQAEAEIAVQVLSHQAPLHLAPKFIGIEPSEVVWSNMNLTWWQRLVKSLGAACFNTALVIFWAIPVAFAGFISQINNLIALFPWLDFLDKLPSFLYGILTALLPIVVMAIVMMLPPILIRLSAKIAGMPTVTHIEFYTQNVFFAFNMIQTFFVLTVAASAMTVIQNIMDDPSSVFSLLQTNIPNASNFYIYYFLFTGLTVPFASLLQLVPLLLYHALGTILDNTPRKVWNRQNILGGLGWGTVLPVYTMLGCISFIYAIIAPLLLLFSAGCFGLVYIAFLHNTIFINKATNGRGIYYARALQQLFTGLYIAELCLVALFVFAKRWGPLVLEVAMLLFTIYVQVQMQHAFDPLLFNLPRSLTCHEDVGTTSTEKLPSIPDRRQSDEKTVSGSVNDKFRPRSTSQVGLVDNERGYAAGTPGAVPKGTFVQRLFKPFLFCTPEVLSHTLLSNPIWHTVPPPLTREEEQGAYYNPAFTATNPVVWFPADPWGWAHAEVQDLRQHDIDATDEGAWYQIDETKHKAKLYYSENPAQIPIYSPPPAY